ncbi:hypothetical protein E2C01_083414 [Portunus trituberculatus]|uniref:Uncharacterized protein n=1 Tax=Portunus trituberculatus TaxID=210409 RepID=A0A5B7J6J3_PORTR|nr:hypothetical protein [Portunus trituberculatus]
MFGAIAEVSCYRHDHNLLPIHRATRTCHLAGDEESKNHSDASTLASPSVSITVQTKINTRFITPSVTTLGQHTPPRPLLITAH